MERRRQLTDYLPVTRRGGKRGIFTKGRQEKDDGESTVRRKRQPASRRAGATERETAGDTERETAVTALPQLSPLDNLIQFDLDWRFGPCTGITRLERWQRADELGLTPPKNIRDILMAHQADDRYQSSLWSSYSI
ncbi:DNA polymerase delta subunit 4 [Eleutherodactylus coqui]|uniref:DNA polymerase delta subunit 4 n=1 Tax=Eleutherodactylus coqui TaxID=57060 RepID=UPI003461F624